MKIFLFCLVLLAVGMLALTIFSLDFARLSNYGLGYLAGKVVLLLLGITCLYFLGKNIFKQHLS